MSSASPARMEHALTYDPDRQRLVLFGGVGSNGLLGDTWELPPPAPATWTRHGLGCAGSAGTPSLDAAPGSLPALGSTFQLRLSSLPAQPGAAWLAFGFDVVRWNGRALPVALGPFGLPGCDLWIGPEPGLGILLMHRGSVGHWALTIPNDARLAGAIMGTQALVLDPASPGSGAVTNGGILRIQ